MYAYIKGIVEESGADRAVVEAAGVGYELFCSTMTLKTLIVGKPAKLYTHLHLAEGVQALYGFADTEERDMFRRLLTLGFCNNACKILVQKSRKWHVKYEP